MATIKDKILDAMAKQNSPGLDFTGGGGGSGATYDPNYKSGPGQNIPDADGWVADPYTGAWVNVRTGEMRPGPYTVPVGGTGGGGGRSGGGGGGGGVRTTQSDKEFFWSWMGRYPTASELYRMADEGWNMAVMRRFAAENGGDGPEIQMLRNTIKQIGAGFYNNDPTLVPDSIVKSLIIGGYDMQYISNVYFPSLRGANLNSPGAQKYIDAWVEMTGRPIGPTAMQKLSDTIKIYGYSGEAEAIWMSWLKTTDSAVTGNWGAAHRANIDNAIQSLYGREATDWELHKDSALWDLNESALLEYLRGTVEYDNIYGGKPAWMSENEFIDTAMAYDQIFRWYYEDSIINADGSITIGPGTEATEVPGSTVPGTWAPPAAWKSLSNAQFASDLQKYGVKIENGRYMRGGQELTLEELDAILPKGVYWRDEAGYHYTQEYGAIDPRTGQPVTENIKAPDWKSLTNEKFASDLRAYGITVSNGRYLKDGRELSLDEIEELLPKDTYWRDEAGFHYVQEHGAINPVTGEVETEHTKPVTGRPGAPAPSAGLGQWGINFLNTDMMSALINGNISPQVLQQQFAWTEEADYWQGVNEDTLVEAFGEGFSTEDWYKMVSGGQGAGALRAQLQQAENRVAFREAYRNYFGTDPTPENYDYLTNNFVNPSEYAHRMAAKESAKMQIDQVNELLERVFGRTTTLEELENLAMGGEDSGILQSMLDQATRLDAFRWQHKQYYGSEPTPDDYAKYAGYASTAELEWDITTAEKLAEYAPEIKKAWAKTYGHELDDASIKVLLGEQEGYGDLRRQWREAQEKASETDTARLEAHRVRKTQTGYQQTQQGGMQESWSGMGDLY